MKNGVGLDYILNGNAVGDVGATLLANNMDPYCLRPYIDEDGRTYITNRAAPSGTNNADSRILVANANATLRKDDWIHIDEAIIKAARPRLRAVADLITGGLTYQMPNGMAHTVLQYEKMTDTTQAIVSMDGERESENAAPEFELLNLPLPIIHKDFSFSLRQILASRNGGSPLDTTMAEQAARQVAEMAEKLLLGTAGSYTFGGGSLYGYTNFPQRITKSMTLPTAPGWLPSTTMMEVMEMKQASKDDFHYGPWVLYTSPAWDTVLDDDFSAAKGDITLRDRIKKIEGISDIRVLDYLTGYQMILVQMTSDVVRLVQGMQLTTVQWDSKGGMRKHFKVMAIMVPQLRCDINNNTGIVHGTAA